MFRLNFSFLSNGVNVSLNCIYLCRCCSISSVTNLRQKPCWSDTEIADEDQSVIMPMKCIFMLKLLSSSATRNSPILPLPQDLFLLIYVAINVKSAKSILISFPIRHNAVTRHKRVLVYFKTLQDLNLASLTTRFYFKPNTSFTKIDLFVNKCSYSAVFIMGTELAPFAAHHTPKSTLTQLTQKLTILTHIIHQHSWI